jgi:hypothetical protein
MQPTAIASITQRASPTRISSFETADEVLLKSKTYIHCWQIKSPPKGCQVFFEKRKPLFFRDEV